MKEMALDIIVFGIFVICALIGYRRGLLRTLSHTVGWIAAILCACFLLKPVSGFLKNCTVLFEYMKNAAAERIETQGSSVISGISLLPDAMQKGAQSAADDAVSASASAAADAGIMFISFAGIFIISLVLILLLARYITKKTKKGVIGFANRLCGLVIGAAMGIIIALLFSNLLIPFTGVFAPDRLQEVQNAMEASVMAKMLHDFDLIGTFFDFLKGRIA